MNWTPSPTTIIPGTQDIGYYIYSGSSPSTISSTPDNFSPVAVDCTSFSVCTWDDLLTNVPYQTYFFQVEAVVTETGLAAVSPWSLASATIPGSASDTLVASGLGVHTLALSETLTVSDSITRVVGFRRAGAETLTASDSMARAAVYGRNNSETYVATDAMGSSHGTPGSHEESLSETLTFTDTVVRQITFGRMEVETLSESDVLARLAPHFRSAAESLAFGDLLLGAARSHTTVLPQHEGKVPGRRRSGTVQPH